MSGTKVVILAGGMGLRLFEETISTPKPMVIIEDRPIIWHVMARFAHFGFNDFVICLGYKSEISSSDFLNLDHTVLESGATNKHILLDNGWKINLVETGAETMTAGRLKRVGQYLTEDFFMAYSDNISDIDVTALYNFHKAQANDCTLTVIHPKLNYGVVLLEDSMVKGFVEKPVLDNVMVNAGYFVCKKQIINMIKDDSSVFELEVMDELVKQGKLNAYIHNGFWRSVDTYKDLTEIRTLNVSKIIKNE